MYIFFGILAAIAGVALIIKTQWFLENFGTINWAEQHLGYNGGTRLMYKIIGLALIFIGFLLITNLFGGFVEGTSERYFRVVNLLMSSGTALLNPHKVFAKVGLAKGMRVADLGCGRTGHFVFSAARAVGETGMIYAVDVVKEVLENIRNRVRSEGYDNVQTVWSDIERLGKTAIPAGSLDGCFIINVLFLVKDKGKVIEESVRLLKKGGFLVIIDWKQKLGPCGPIPEMMVVPEHLMTLASHYHLQPIDQFSDSTYHYCLIFRKS